MSLMRNILLNAFGRPRGLLGRVGGRVMARTNAEFGIRVSGLLNIRAEDHVLEVGFGPGVVVEHIARLVSDGHVAGVDVSPVMVAQARTRNAEAISGGLVELHEGSVEEMPFADASFDQALAINSMQVWPDAATGLREIGRVLKPDGRLALGFTPHSRQGREEPTEKLAAAGFEDVRVVDVGEGFCVTGRRE